MDTTYVPTSSCGFGGEGLWLFAILALFGFGGNGFLGGRNGERNATVGDVQRATDFAALERQNNETVASVRQGVYDTSAAIKDGNYNILGELRDLQTAANAGFAEQSKCCCEINRNIDSVRFDMANYSAATQAAIHSEGEQTRNMLQQNKIEALQAQINQLQLNNAMCGVVRYPTSSVYSAPMPFMTMGNGCCGNI